MKLGVNVDHVATIRQARMGREPDPVTAAALAELSGADGIVVHLREDRRHIQERDVRLLRETIQTRLDLEMAATDEMCRFACEIKPEMATLVPERREELSTEGGLDVCALREKIAHVVARLQEQGILVALFIDPEAAQMEAAKAVSADLVEVHTGRYANASGKAQAAELRQIVESVQRASELGLGVNAGHGLNYANVAPIARIPGIVELNIGHSIISRSVLLGISASVREMKVCIDQA